MFVGNKIKKNYNLLYNRSMRVNSFELYFHTLTFLPNQIHIVENRISIISVFSIPLLFYLFNQTEP